MADSVLVAACSDPRPLVVHVVYRFDTGGLENGVVNLINHLPAERFRHAVVALTDVTGFAQRVQRGDVTLVALRKGPGHGVWLYPRLWKLFRAMAPAIVHTRNIAALEAQVPAWLARVPVRIHGEHGRDVDELNAKRARYLQLRRLYRPFVQHQIALSRELAEYLRDEVGVDSESALTELCNGVDTARFHPAADGGPACIEGCPFDAARCFVVGTVGRMQVVKDQLLLARAFARALALAPQLRSRLRLALIGDGPLKAQCDAVLTEAGVRDMAWLPGERSDVADVMRGFSTASCCRRWPRASPTPSSRRWPAACPCSPPTSAATPSLVDRGVSGELVPSGDVEVMARRIAALAGNTGEAQRMGRAGRAARRAALQPRRHGRLPTSACTTTRTRPRRLCARGKPEPCAASPASSTPAARATSTARRWRA